METNRTVWDELNVVDPITFRQLTCLHAPASGILASNFWRRVRLTRLELGDWILGFDRSAYWAPPWAGGVDKKSSEGGEPESPSHPNNLEFVYNRKTPPCSDTM